MGTVTEVDFAKNGYLIIEIYLRLRVQINV